MYIKWEKPDLNQRARASINFVDCKFIWRIFFQRNVSYPVHCNRHVLSAVNFHNRHTDDDGFTALIFKISTWKVQSAIMFSF